MRRLFVVLALLGLAACGDNNGNNDATTTATTTTTTAAVEGSTTSTTSRFSRTPVSMSPRNPQATLRSVRVGKHDGFIRVVFEFDTAPPGFAVQPAEPPFTQDGSGAEVHVDGNGHLTVRFESARAHNDEGHSTVSTKRIDGPSGGSVTEIVFAGDFEGVVNYVIGTTGDQPFTVDMLEDPGRIVIDLQSP